MVGLIKIKLTLEQNNLDGGVVCLCVLVCVRDREKSISNSYRVLINITRFQTEDLFFYIYSCVISEIRDETGEKIQVQIGIL